jgi:hypothetical protein
LDIPSHEDAADFPDAAAEDADEPGACENDADDEDDDEPAVALAAIWSSKTTTLASTGKSEL